MVSQYKTIDLFSGCGGLSLGFKEAGFEVIAANDIWEISLKTFKNNFPESRTILGDINKHEIQDQLIKACNGNADVVIGGPPCQAYSLAGSRNPEDPRGKLFNSYVDIVEKIRPKIFVIENVRGILSMKHFIHSTPSEVKNRYYSILEERKSNHRKISIESLNFQLENYLIPVPELIKKTFEEIGYFVEHQLLNSANYGVPQKRLRVFFIGTLQKKGIRFPPATHSNQESFDLNKWVTLKDAIGDLPFPDIGEGDELYDGTYSPIYMSRNRRRAWDEVSFTIQAGQRHIPLHPASPPMSKIGVDKQIFGEGFSRRLSVRECARVQTFPDSFEFCGKTVHKYRQIGNAVPPSLAKHIALAVSALL